MSEIAGALKVGTTALVLDLIEQAACPLTFDLADPIAALKIISRDSSLQSIVKLTNGHVCTGIDIQRAYLTAAQQCCAGQSADADWVLTTWAQVLDDLERDPRLLPERLDWVAKQWLLETFVAAERIGWDDPWFNPSTSNITTSAGRKVSSPNWCAKAR